MSAAPARHDSRPTPASCVSLLFRTPPKSAPTFEAPPQELSGICVLREPPPYVCDATGKPFFMEMDWSDRPSCPRLLVAISDPFRETQSSDI